VSNDFSFPEFPPLVSQEDFDWWRKGQFEKREPKQLKPIGQYVGDNKVLIGGGFSFPDTKTTIKVIAGEKISFGDVVYLDDAIVFGSEISKIAYKVK